MEPTTFGYSKFVAFSGMILFGGILIVLLYFGISLQQDTKALHHMDAKEWLSLCLALVLALSGVFAFSKWCIIPMLQGRITLELDEEKLQHYISGTTIYWKDVVEISARGGGSYAGVTFQMVAGCDDLTLSTKWVEGSTKSIVNKMQEYFARTL